MKKHDDILLHLLTKHTNLQVPFSDYVKSNKFPAQISELLNTEVNIKYRNYYETDLETETRAAVIIRNGEKVSSRPSDDIQQLEDREPSLYEKEEKPFYYEEPFIVLRADAEKPFRLIAVSKDYSKIIVNSTEIIDGDYLFLTKVSEYPIQMNEYIGLQCEDQYAGDIVNLNSVTLRVDKCEPCYSVLMEYVGDNKVRFILGDEAISKITMYQDDNPDTFFREPLTDAEIITMRKLTIGGKTIYGTH